MSKSGLLIAALAVLIALAAAALVVLRRDAAAPAAPVADAAAPAEAATAAIPPPAGGSPVDLAAVLDLREPGCTPGPVLESILERMVRVDPETFESRRGGPIEVPGFDTPLAPTFERRREIDGAADIRFVTADLGLAGRWHGLGVTGLRRSFYEESDSASFEIRFADPPQRVRQALLEAGFPVGPIGEAVELEQEGIGVYLAVEATEGGGAAMVCAQG